VEENRLEESPESPESPDIQDPPQIARTTTETQLGRTFPDVPVRGSELESDRPPPPAEAITNSATLTAEPGSLPRTEAHPIAVEKKGRHEAPRDAEAVSTGNEGHSPAAVGSFGDTRQLLAKKNKEIQRLQEGLQEALATLLRQSADLRAAQDAAISLSTKLQASPTRSPSPKRTKHQALPGADEDALMKHPKRLLCAEVIEQRLEMRYLHSRLRTERSFLQNSRRETRNVHADNSRLQATIDRQNEAIQFLAKALKNQVQEKSGENSELEDIFSSDAYSVLPAAIPAAKNASNEAGNQPAVHTPQRSSVPVGASGMPPESLPPSAGRASSPRHNSTSSPSPHR